MPGLPPAVVQIQLLHVLHRAFVQARNLALRGDCQQLADLADTFEVIPELMAHWDESTLARIRSILAEYEARHPQFGYEYASLLGGHNTSYQSNGDNVSQSSEDQAKTSNGRINGSS
jgi:hypothetical protein